MDFYDYIQETMPDKIVSKITGMGFPYNNDYSLDENVRTFVKQCNSNQIDEFLEYVAKNHPDKDLILEYNQPKKIFKATGDSEKKETIVEVPKQDSKIDNEKVISETIQKNLLKIAVIGVIIFLAIKNIK